MYKEKIVMKTYYKLFTFKLLMNISVFILYNI